MMYITIKINCEILKLLLNWNILDCRSDPTYSSQEELTVSNIAMAVNISWEDAHNEGQKEQRPIYQKQKRLRRGGKNTQKNHTKKVLMTWITMMTWSLT